MHPHHEMQSHLGATLSAGLQGEVETEGKEGVKQETELKV